MAIGTLFVIFQCFFCKNYRVHHCESQKEFAVLTPVLSTKATTLFGIWNVRTVYKAGKTAHIAFEMTV